jgi:AraC-like DNA-binding protein
MAAAGTTRSIGTMMLPTQQSILLLQVIEQWGTNPASALHGTGLKMTDLEDDDTWISYRQTMHIVDNAYKLTGCDSLGLDVGSAEDISTFGILGYAMLSCATVGEALAVGEKYQRAAQNLCDVQLEMSEDQITISAATPFVLKPSGYRFAIEELFSGVMKLIRVLSGEDLYPHEIHCAYGDPGYREYYESVFQCPVHFNESGNRMVLKSKLLDFPILHANKFNARMSEKLCEEILYKYIGEEDLTTRIRHIILRVPGKFPNEATVADALAVSGRTMRRQLSALGTSYREVLDQVRSDLAQQYLQNSSLNVEQVGQLLGYTETTNFRRAFKRWMGVSPQDYRQRRIHPQDPRPGTGENDF